ncbi:MAG: acyl-CoA dehydrogenase family protein [Thermodesulfobacteriota bacterium]|nr:acyl-CoA dehydrogenase family protein [Thermodesulfobacteriota bacterium]
METLRTLPGDDVRQIMWRFADRFDLQMAVQSARAIARSVVARLVADGVRHSHEWNDRKAEILEAFDASGLTAIYMDLDQGGFIEGPKNLAMCLVAWELAWVDGGAATCSLAGCLALAPIHERGTPEQRSYYMGQCVPPAPGEDRETLRGAFALTEPIPYVGVDTGILVGKVSVAEWEDGAEPVLQVEKRGRFITNMDFAGFVTAAVDTNDERIKTSCMVILEENDPGLFDRGAPTLKMVHQLSSTRDPVLSLKVPASRIIGGYTVKDGVIVPNYSHGEIIAAVFNRTRIPVGLMTSAKLLSAIEPVIRYQRGRFRGGDAVLPGSPRYELGLQMNEDAQQRLLDVWATGEAGASLGFEAARLFDVLDPLERRKDEIFAEQGISGMRKQMAALRKVQNQALEYLDLSANPDADQERLKALEADELTRYVLLEAEAGVLCPACKLWNTGHGATMMREAVSLMGGYGITEDCPGFLGHKWMDAQLEATYEGPEAVQRRHLSVSALNPVFMARFGQWMDELFALESRKPGMGAKSLAAAMRLWRWTQDYLQTAKDSERKRLYHGKRQGVTFPLADALCWLLAARSLVYDILELEEKGPMNPVVAEGLSGLVSFYTDLCRVQAARAAGEAGRVCAELVFGYDDGSGQGFDGAEEFFRLRQELDASLAGARSAKDRAARALTGVMIPEALDYPL